MRNSHLEVQFQAWLEEKDYAQYFVSEYNILKPKRLWKSRKSNWRIDFLSTKLKIAIEIQGGTFSGGGHSRGAYQHSDFDKANYLQNLGYDIYYLDTLHIRNNDYEMIEFAIRGKLFGGTMYVDII